jgi:hypothetical protein
MTMYHVATPENAAAIERDGFDDRAEERFEGTLFRGIRLSNEPIWELVEIDPVAIVIDLAPESLVAYECTSGIHGYRQWVVPSSVVNHAKRWLLSRDAWHRASHA